MTLETFFDKFDDLVDSSDRIPDVRKFIVSALIHAALNEDHVLDSANQIRSELLEANPWRENQTRSKRAKGSQELTPEDLPPQLQDLQVELFGRLDEVATIEKGLSPIQKTKPGPYPLVVTAEERGSSETFDFVGPAVAIPMVSSTGHGHASLKRIHYQEGEFAAGNILSVIKPTCPKLINARFLYEYLTAFKEELLVARMSGTANVSLTVTKLNEVPVPLITGPALQRVDELMALCDRLEAQQQERDTRHAALARASLARFAEAPTPANLHHLFHPSYTIPPADLRKSILTLAVQGKLVPQDPTKENGNVELEEIFKRKATMLSNKEIRKTEIGRPIESTDIDHEIPSTWNWVRLVDICELITDGTHQTPKYTDSGRMFLSAQNVKPFKFMPAKHRFVSEEHYQGYIKNRKPGIGDILLTRVGAGIGQAASIDQELDFAIYVSLGLIRPVGSMIFPDYITVWLNSPDGTAKSSKNTYGKGVSQGNLNLGLIRQFLVPLPPLAEQRRIVAKVDQLMALVDELETQLSASHATAKNLLQALVAELTTA